MIQYIYLKNVAGIYNGMDRKEIELNFTHNDNKFNLICGNNGSGKSTLANSLDPFATESIRTGKKGEKRIIIKIQKNSYDIRHFYEPTETGHSVKSFITKIDKHGVREELNKNGNVTSFKTTVELEIGVSEASIQLFKLGRDLSSIIKMTPSERKSYMTKFTEGADIYMVLFKKISDDSRMLKKILDNTTDKLNNIGDIETIDKRLLESNETLSVINEKEAELNNQVSTYKERCNIIMSDKDRSELIALSNDINSLQRKRNMYNISDEMMYMTKEQMSSRIDILTSGINNNNNVLLMLRSDKENIHSELKDIQDDKCIVREEIDSISITDEYEDIVESVNMLKNKSLSISKEYDKSDKYKHLTISYIKQVIESFENISDNISCMADDMDYDTLSSYRYDTDYDDMYKDINRTINELTLELGDLNGDAKSMNYLSELSHKLTLRPTECFNNTCPFIIDAMSKTADIDKLNNISIDIDIINKNIIELRRSMDIVWSMSKLTNLIRRLFKLIENTDKSLSDMVCNRSDIVENISRNKFKFIDKTKMIKVIQLLELREEYLENNNKIMYLQDIQINSAKYNNLSDRLYSLEEQEVSIKHKLNSNADKIDEYVLNNNKMTRDLNEFVDVYDIKDKLDKLDSKIERLNDLQERMDTVTGYYKQISIIKNNDLAKLSDMRSVCNKDRDKLLVKKTEAKKLKKYKKLIVDKYKDVDILRRALSTKEGIPLLFVSILLQEIRNIANEILSDAFEDTIQLGKFKIDAKEFRIPVIGKGDENKDASKASAGERAIISLAMSLALSKQAGAKYTSLILDELDGPLDSKRRRGFLRLLDKQTDKLNITQVFNITHNNMFDDYPANLILLKDADVSKLKDKHIIFEY